MLLSLNWLQSYFQDPLPSPAEVARVLTMHSNEVENIEEVTLPNGERDTILDFKVLPNRAADLLCHRGVARELAVLLDRPLEQAKETITAIDISLPTPVIVVEDAVYCPRYMSRVIYGVRVADSPEWLQRLLIAIGQRPINNIVDAANYAMFAVGQPLHAFDLDTLSFPKGKPGLSVRRARANEKMTTLDGCALTLNESMLVIADEMKVLALAGIKGGDKGAVTEKTANVLLEAASFAPVPIRKTARGLQLFTDASKRYENNLAPELVPEGMELMTNLILEFCGGKAGSLADIFAQARERHKLATTLANISATIGTSVDAAQVENILSRFQKYAGWKWEKAGERYVATLPYERSDLYPRKGRDEYASGVEADFVEEIARVYGYENIPSVPPSKIPPPALPPLFYWSERLRALLLSKGFSELLTYAFVEKKTDKSVELENPLAGDKKYLRASLAPQLLERLESNKTNKDLLGLAQIKVFEIGHVFSQESERVHLAIALEDVGKNNDARNDIESLALDIQRALGLPSLRYELLKNTKHGVLELDVEEIISALPAPEQGDTLPPQPTVVAHYEKFSLYPFVVRDIAVWTGGEREELAEMIGREAGELLIRLNLFDTFQKPDSGKTSYAYRLVFQSPERTLTNTEVDAVMQKIYARVNARGWTVR